jgi:hypothetical protein
MSTCMQVNKVKQGLNCDSPAAAYRKQVGRFV